MKAIIIAAFFSAASVSASASALAAFGITTELCKSDATFSEIPPAATGDLTVTDCHLNDVKATVVGDGVSSLSVLGGRSYGPAVFDLRPNGPLRFTVARSSTERFTATSSVQITGALPRGSSIAITGSTFMNRFNTELPLFNLDFASLQLEGSTLRVSGTSFFSYGDNRIHSATVLSLPSAASDSVLVVSGSDFRGGVDKLTDISCVRAESSEGGYRNATIVGRNNFFYSLGSLKAEGIFIDVKPGSNAAATGLAGLIVSGNTFADMTKPWNVVDTAAAPANAHFYSNTVTAESRMVKASYRLAYAASPSALKLTIENNTFTAGPTPRLSAVISVTVDDVPAHSAIAVSGNKIKLTNRPFEGLNLFGFMLFGLRSFPASASVGFFNNEVVDPEGDIGLRQSTYLISFTSSLLPIEGEGKASAAAAGFNNDTTTNKVAICGNSMFGVPLSSNGLIEDAILADRLPLEVADVSQCPKQQQQSALEAPPARRSGN